LPLSESQLEIWSHQGATAIAEDTNTGVHNALKAVTSGVRSRDVEVYLQGSYRNTTNIRGESDVDIIVQLNDVYYRDLYLLTEAEKGLYEASHPPAAYTFTDFRRDVLGALQAYFGQSVVTPSNKCLNIAPAPGRLPADVVPCLQYRLYQNYRSQFDERYIEGIAFYTQREGRRVINYPKRHYANGVDKNSLNRCSGNYKPSVRMFKNARSYLIDQGRVSKDLAPSYFVECLIYNAPDADFSGSFQLRFISVINGLLNLITNGKPLYCGNGVVPLFGDTPEQWSRDSAATFLIKLFELYRDGK
jgi:hypothetical protein